MTIAERIIELSKEIPEDKLAEVIDFMEFLKEKELKQRRSLIDEIMIEDNETLEELAK
ncbi:Protein of unknown function [Clostridium cavendishii DSM 21758]|uniref:DUF2281 domain-containing protein n=1 Tax=Clostridium cavendishii DSM 21758 TaxID=1121302 RepID=A0A1M6NP32_9CLOT|nr:DUF2281 domain-containing protein [Clostridium cavendishii]SHJ97418.1 Protein of unknown function [Clostridium cavendishii DSM 21758]